jgi:hypothetical protein
MTRRQQRTQKTPHLSSIQKRGLGCSLLLLVVFASVGAALVFGQNSPFRETREPHEDPPVYQYQFDFAANTRSNAGSSSQGYISTDAWNQSKLEIVDQLWNNWYYEAYNLPVGSAGWINFTWYVREALHSNDFYLLDGDLHSGIRLEVRSGTLRLITMDSKLTLGSFSAKKAHRISLYIDLETKKLDIYLNQNQLVEGRSDLFYGIPQAIDGLFIHPPGAYDNYMYISNLQYT